jgi:hypothetical protein
MQQPFHHAPGMAAAAALRRKSTVAVQPTSAVPDQRPALTVLALALGVTALLL